MINILIVDDHPIVRHGLRLILSQHDDIKIIGEAVSGEDAINFVAHTKPDIILMDVEMPGMGGLEAIRRIVKYHGASTKIIVLTVAENENLLDLCVWGYLTKYCEPSQLIECIRQVHSGKRSIDAGIAQEIAIQRMNKSYFKDKDSVVDINRGKA